MAMKRNFFIQKILKIPCIQSSQVSATIASKRFSTSFLNLRWLRCKITSETLFFQRKLNIAKNTGIFSNKEFSEFHRKFCQYKKEIHFFKKYLKFCATIYTQFKAKPGFRFFYYIFTDIKI